LLRLSVGQKLFFMWCAGTGGWFF